MPRERKLSKYKNITFKDGYWLARLYIDGENHHVGSYKTEEQAKRAQDEARKNFKEKLYAL